MSLFPSHLRNWRQERHLTQAELAHQAGVPRPNLIDLESGRRDCTLKTLEKLARALNISPGTLLDQNPFALPSLGRHEVDLVARAILKPEIKLSPSLHKVLAWVGPLVFPIVRAAGFAHASGLLLEKGRVKRVKAQAEAALGRDQVARIVSRVSKLAAGGA